VIGLFTKLGKREDVLHFDIAVAGTTEKMESIDLGI
jgi:hypothetical protein